LQVAQADGLEPSRNIRPLVWRGLKA
jgi:hypothetical protein